MQSFTTIVAASAILTVVSGFPVLSPSAQDVCGNVPSGSTSQPVLSQPSGVNTAAACQVNCDANAPCQSFVFGMVDNANKCILFSCAASAIPMQSSTNLVAYDKACQSVPTVTPTASNPTGMNKGNAGNTGPNSNTGVGKPTNPKLAIRETCGGPPTGQTNVAPLSTPANIASLEDCQAHCKANPSCQSFEFGTLTPGGSNICRLFAVPAPSVPAPSSGQTFKVYNVGCSL